jgi:hypothetical protein
LHQDSASKRDDAWLGIRESLNQRFTHLLLLSAVAGSHSGRPQKNFTDLCESQVSVVVSLVVQKVKKGSDRCVVSSNHAHSVSVLESVTLDRALKGFKRENLLVSFELSEQAIFDGHLAGRLGHRGGGRQSLAGDGLASGHTLVLLDQRASHGNGAGGGFVAHGMLLVKINVCRG